MTPHEIYINGLAEQVHRDNVAVGWWDDPDRCIYTCIQLIVTEIAEATEGARKSLPDTHLPHYNMEEVEYADALIRLLDLGGKLQLKFSEQECVVDSWCSNVSIPIGKQHLGLVKKTLDFAHAYMDYDYRPSYTYKSLLEMQYSDLIKNIFQVAHNRGYGLIETVEEKLIYNRSRSDHKRENRQGKVGQKAF